MRVALLLSGKFRDSYIAFNSLEKNLISKYNPDIFISYNYDSENDLDCSEDELKSLYNPKLINYHNTPSLVGEYIESVKDYPVASESNTLRIFNMWYGISEANKLKSKYEEENQFKYDIVIRTRFDIELLTEVELRFWNDSLFIPIGSDHRDGFNDFMAYGSSHCMDYYCSTFKHLVDYIKEGELIHPERLLRRHLKDIHNCRLIRTYIPMKLRGVLVNHIDYSIIP